MTTALEVKGKDARDFLQRLTTAHVTKMGVGTATLGLLLNAQSKIFGAFTILYPTQDEYILVFETEQEFTRVKDEFERLHFSEKIEFTALSGTGGVLKKATALKTEDRFFPLTQNGDTFTWPSFVPEKVAVFSKSAVDILSQDEWSEARIFSGEPVWGHEYTEASNALDVGLQPWIHDNKGCYPGQEVVERSLSIGHPARVLVKLDIAANVDVGAALLVDGKEVGKITSVSPRGVSALGIVQWNYRNQTHFATVTGGEIRCRK